VAAFCFSRRCREQRTNTRTNAGADAAFSLRRASLQAINAGSAFAFTTACIIFCTQSCYPQISRIHADSSVTIFSPLRDRRFRQWRADDHTRWHSVHCLRPGTNYRSGGGFDLSRSSCARVARDHLAGSDTSIRGSATIRC
jgi:hypothetical protein